MIGWDEILEGGLAPNPAVMSWRGVEGGIVAAKAGHNVVMTPEVPLLPESLPGEIGRSDRPKEWTPPHEPEAALMSKLGNSIG